MASMAETEPRRHTARVVTMSVRCSGRRRVASLARILAVAGMLPAAAMAESKCGTPLPELRDPCRAFAGETRLVQQTLEMDLEDRRVALRIPETYFEDFWDRRDGFTDTAQLFRVEIGSFEPVSRIETGRRNESGIWNWMTFVIGDFIPLEELAELHVEQDVSTLRMPPTFPDLPRTQGPFSLTSLVRGVDQRPRLHDREVFVSLDSVGSLSAVLTCDTPQTANYPHCSQWFRAAGMDVKLACRRVELPRWQALQHDVTAFLTCATALD